MKQGSKSRKIIGIICVILVLAFTIYLSVIMTGRINRVVLKDSYIRIYKSELVICAVCLILSFDILFGFFTAMKNKFLKAIGWIFRGVLILSVGFVFFLGLKTCIGGLVKTPGTSGNAIVLGLALQNGQPVPDLVDRVDTAAQFSKENPDATLILTGGNPDKNGKTEAAVMRDLLIERGVSEDRIVLEDRAKTTIDNFSNTAKMVDPAQPIVLITSNYHIERSVKTANDAGFTNVLRRPAKSSFSEYGANVMWEVIHTLNSYKSMLKKGNATTAENHTKAPDTDADSIDYLALVNKLNPLPDKWEDKLQTITIVNSVGDEVEVEKKAYAAYELLKDDLEVNDGIYLELDSARRSVAAQQDIMDRFIEKYGADYAAKTVAKPGYSEHHTGLALDLYFKLKNADGSFTDVYYNEDMVQYPEIWSKIHAKLADYGFILRYLEGREHITGYGYEPWHIRYVDSTEIARQIMKEDITLEEYLGGYRAPEVTIDYVASELFTQEELDEAIVQIKCKFASFSGCELHSIRYAGDEKNNEKTCH